MKSPLSIALAASLTLTGCALLHRSPTWDAVVKSRSHYSDAAAASAKDGYLQHLHRVLSDAGVEHKIVTYQIHFHNVYREEAVDTATAILYRDETTPRDPWWVMDEYHNVPVWLPSWALDAQLEFFTKQEVTVISVKEYAGGGAHQPRVSGQPRSPRRLIASVSKPHKQRTPFAVGITKSHAAPRAKAPATQPSTDPLNALTLGGHSAQNSDPHTDSLFRSVHGTAFDPGSSVDRQKMDELKRRLLNRNRSVQLRTE
jgi:hypothetical protein